MLPFTEEIFYSVFAEYNGAIWPVQIIAYALGLLIVLLILKPRKGSNKLIIAILTVFWVWVGAIYHWMYFATINFAAWTFGALFLIQGLLFAWTGFSRTRIQFRFNRNLYGWIGLSFIIFAMGIYPLIGRLTGYSWSQIPLFGTAPSPTTLFTLGLLLLTERRGPYHLMVIPLLCLVIAVVLTPQFSPALLQHIE